MPERRHAGVAFSRSSAVGLVSCRAFANPTVPSKKKTAPEPEVVAPPDPRDALEPTPANLKAVLADLEKVLADVPVPPPPEPKKAVAPPPAPVAPPAPRSDDDGEDEEGGKPAAGSGTPAPAPVVEEPPGPETDLVEAMLHIYFADGLPCGYGQEARRRIRENFVDRNEFRVTEAYEVEDLLRDLEIPNLFDRCLWVRDSIAQIYNDQNGVNLGFLRHAGISDRNTFFQRAPALQPHVVHFLGNLLTLEEMCFSDKSTLRAQQRFGFDPKDAAVGDFLNKVRVLLAPYRGMPLDVGKDSPRGKPNLTHTLSPTCLLMRLGPAAKGTKKR